MHAKNALILGDGQFRGLLATQKPRKKMLMKVLSRWAGTLAIIGAIYAVLFVYSNMSVMTNTAKRQFNALITGLSIALALAITSALNRMVADLRWWILSRRHRSRRKVELILQADNMKHAILLAARSRRHSIHAAALLWLLLTIGSQVGLAAIGLCYSVDAADEYALLVPGNVSIANMSSITTEKIVKSQPTSLGAQQFTANSYGSISLAYDTAVPEAQAQAGDIWVPGDPLQFCGVDYCQYIFHETAAESLENAAASPITVATARSINTTAVCNSWPVIQGGSGTENTITITTDSGNMDFFVPVLGGVDQTTFITNTLIDCGPGCSIVAAFEASDTAPWYYDCNITVGSVANATRSEHEVGRNLTTMASGAIALQGYDVLSLANNTHFQYQIYPAESVFGMPLHGITSAMSAMMARFAIGVVAIAAENNDKLVIAGSMPVAGLKLNVGQWNYINLILILTASLQLILGVAVVLVANQVVVPDNGPIAEAQVLRAMATQIQLERSGGAKEGSLSGDDRLNSVWIYRERLMSDETYDLYMEEAHIMKNDSEMTGLEQKRSE